MAGQIIPVNPAQPCSVQTITLGETRYRLRLAYNARLAGWYADLYLLDGTAVWQGQRVSVSWALGAGLEPENAPAGLLLVRGPAEPRREDLGAALKLVFYADADLPEVAASELGITVTVP